MKFFKTLALIVVGAFCLGTAQITTYEVMERMEKQDYVRYSEMLAIQGDTAFIDLDYIGPDSYTAFKHSICTCGTAGIKDIRIRMANPGGVIYHMFAIYDLMMDAKAKFGMHFVTEARGLIASAAVPIFLAGDTRVCSPNTYFMIHPHSGNDDLENAYMRGIQIPDSVIKMFKEWTERYAQIVADNTKMTKLQCIQRMKGTSNNVYFFNAEEAYNMGFVDGLV